MEIVKKKRKKKLPEGWGGGKTEETDQRGFLVETVCMIL